MQVRFLAGFLIFTSVLVSCSGQEGDAFSLSASVLSDNSLVLIPSKVICFPSKKSAKILKAGCVFSSQKNHRLPLEKYFTDWEFRLANSRGELLALTEAVQSPSLKSQDDAEGNVDIDIDVAPYHFRFSMQATENQSIDDLLKDAVIQILDKQRSSNSQATVSEALESLLKNGFSTETDTEISTDLGLTDVSDRDNVSVSLADGPDNNEFAVLPESQRLLREFRYDVSKAIALGTPPPVQSVEARLSDAEVTQVVLGDTLECHIDLLPEEDDSVTSVDTDTSSEVEITITEETVIEWLRGDLDVTEGVATGREVITGADQSTYVTGAADGGKKLACRVKRLNSYQVPSSPVYSQDVRIIQHCGEVLHGGQTTRVQYSKETLPFGSNCDDVGENQTGSCSDGEMTWTGTFPYAQCNVSDNLAPTAPTSVSLAVTSSPDGQLVLPGTVLTCSAKGGADPEGGAITYAYTWTNITDTSKIKGATYTIVRGDEGKTISCAAQAKDGAGALSAAVKSTETHRVIRSCETNPIIEHKERLIGRTLYAKKSPFYYETCQSIANDGECNDGTMVWDNTNYVEPTCALLSNRAPSNPTQVTINISTAPLLFVGQTVTCDCGGTCPTVNDADNDPVTYVYSWSAYSGGSLVRHSSGSPAAMHGTVSGAQYTVHANDNGESITCSIQAKDNGASRGFSDQTSQVIALPALASTTV